MGRGRPGILVSVGLDESRCGSSPQVFLREAARQRLQALLHREVLRLIVTLQRRFRALLERKNFVRMREAAICIQVGDKIVIKIYQLL